MTDRTVSSNIEVCRAAFEKYLGPKAQLTTYNGHYDAVPVECAWLDFQAGWLARPAPETRKTTDHAENLAKSLEHYLKAHDTLSAVQDTDEVSGTNEASDCGLHDAANDAWRAMRTALHEYRKPRLQQETLKPTACPFPELDGTSVDGKHLGPNVWGIGTVSSTRLGSRTNPS